MFKVEDWIIFIAPKDDDRDGKKYNNKLLSTTQFRI